MAGLSPSDVQQPFVVGASSVSASNAMQPILLAAAQTSSKVDGPILWTGLLRTRSLMTEQIREEIQPLTLPHKCCILPAGCWTQSWMRRQTREGLLAGRVQQWAC